MSTTHTVAVVATDARLAGSFLQLLGADIRRRGLGPADRASRFWRFQSKQLPEGQGLPQVRILPPNFSALPEIDLVLLTPVNLFLEAERQRDASSRAGPLGLVSAVICLDSGDPRTEWTEFVRVLVDLMPAHENSLTRGHIEAAFAFVRLHPLAGEAGAPLDLERREALRLANEMFGATREFTIALTTGGEAGPGRHLAAEEAGNVLRWSLTALNPFTLMPGLAAAIGRASAPILLSYALALVTLTVIAPSAPFLALGFACRAVGLGQCSASADLAASEMSSFDPTFVGAAAGLTLALAALMPRRVVVATGSGGRRAKQASVRASLALVAASWTLLLFPRAILAGGLLLAARFVPRIPEPAIATALRAADFRASAVVVGLFLTLVMLSVGHAGAIRRARNLHRARMRLRVQLTSGTIP